jgi:hypothetical protein
MKRTRAMITPNDPADKGDGSNADADRPLDHFREAPIC